MTTQIRKFTPSLLEGAILERLYVERDGVLERIMDRLKDTAHGGGVGHVLVTGPRGAGKTHLISLVHHRLQLFEPPAPVAWLMEDPYEILSYRDLLKTIVERCSDIAPPDEDLVDHLELAILETARSSGPIVVLGENFDEILEQIGDQGQQQLRRLIESERSLQLVVTTTLITKALADQPAPFYGFFNQLRLEPFSTDQAVEYLTRRAGVIGDKDFVEQLEDPERRQMAKRRVQSIEQLAGGQPRIWALLSQGLGIDQLDELVDYLVDNFDDITPYYQSQLRQLAPLQRQVVLTMVRQDRAMSAKALTEYIDSTPTTITKTLRDLTSRGWVQPLDSPLTELIDQRLTYYELSEPLLRLALELKDNTQHEVATILNFVKLWFDPDEITRATSQYAVRAANELTADDPATTARWVQSLRTRHAPSMQQLGDIFDAITDLADGDAEAVLALPNIVRRSIESRIERSPATYIDLLTDLGEQAMISQLQMADHGHSAIWVQRVGDLFKNKSDGATDDQVLSLVVRFAALNAELDVAQTAIEQIVENTTTARTAYLVSLVLTQKRNFKSALKWSELALDRQAKLDEPKLRTDLLYHTGFLHHQLGNPDLGAQYVQQAPAVSARRSGSGTGFDRIIQELHDRR